jgi:hypothetical protein
MIKRQKSINKTFVTMPSTRAILKLTPNIFCKKETSIITITHHVALKIILNLSIDRGEAIMSKGCEQAG